LAKDDSAGFPHETAGAVSDFGFIITVEIPAVKPFVIGSGRRFGYTIDEST
jgi:hypothetical protein